MRSVTLTTNLHKGDNLDSGMPKLLNLLNNNLPPTYKTNWVGAAKLHHESTSTMAVLFIRAIIFIFAILAVQFENFIDPLILLLTVQLACSGVLFIVWATGQSLNIYTQVGLITLIGLITKHGISIVEFANQLCDKNIPLHQAIQQAAKLRLRLILMTTGAMVFGIIPLLLSHDAGYESHRAIGIVLIGGLGFGTLFTLFVLPSLCYVIKVSLTFQPSPKN